MLLYNCIWVVLLVSRLNLAFLSPKLSHGIDKVLVWLYPCGFDNPRNTFRWKLQQLTYVRLQIILFGLRTVNNTLTSSFSPTCWVATISLLKLAFCCHRWTSRMESRMQIRAWGRKLFRPLPWSSPVEVVEVALRIILWCCLLCNLF
jgi:hypothetical protein